MENEKDLIQLSMQFSVRVHQEGEGYTAICEDSDVFGVGKTQDDAVDSLIQTIRLTLKHAPVHQDITPIVATDFKRGYVKGFIEGSSNRYKAVLESLAAEEVEKGKSNGKTKKR